MGGWSVILVARSSAVRSLAGRWSAVLVATLSAVRSLASGLCAVGRKEGERGREMECGLERAVGREKEKAHLYVFPLFLVFFLCFLS